MRKNAVTQVTGVICQVTTIYLFIFEVFYVPRNKPKMIKVEPKIALSSQKSPYVPPYLQNLIQLFEPVTVCPGYTL